MPVSDSLVTALLLYAFFRHILEVEGLCTGVDDRTLLLPFWDLKGLNGASVPRNRKKGRGRRSCVRLYFTHGDHALQALEALRRKDNNVRELFPQLQVEFHREPGHVPAPNYCPPDGLPAANEPMGLSVQLKPPYTAPLAHLVQQHHDSISKQKKAREVVAQSSLALSSRPAPSPPLFSIFSDCCVPFAGGGAPVVFTAEAPEGSLSWGIFPRALTDCNKCHLLCCSHLLDFHGLIPEG